MQYRIKEVADMVGISVRTLHHYDAIGILKPENVTESGYRLYTERDFERLQQILFFKELDFKLQEIKEVLDNPDFDRKDALKIHKELLIEKRKRLEKIIESIDITMDSIEGGIEMSKKEMFDVFDMGEIEKHREKYAKEARDKYGNSEAYKESEKRTSKYSKEDWKKISEDGNEIFLELSNVMDREVGDSKVQEIVEKWRNHISKNFYNCTPEIFSGLAQMYICDERFRENIDRIKPGLTSFLSSAMEHYCNHLDES